MTYTHKIRSTFYTENTLCKLLCKPKDCRVTEDKNNIVYESDCRNCEVVYFGDYGLKIVFRTQNISQELRF